jgi:hypothetical protein
VSTAVWNALERLLECAEDQLERAVCRSFVNPGDDAPHDVCEVNTVNGVVHDGQLWVGHLTDTAGWPALTSDPITCATPFAVSIELGIVRCAQSKLTDVVLIPAAATLTADARQQEEDRQALKNAWQCCWGVSGKDLLPPIWTPINPQGGCVGGVWTLILRDATCLCESPILPVDS